MSARIAEFTLPGGNARSPQARKFAEIIRRDIAAGFDPQQIWGNIAHWKKGQNWK